MGVEGCVSVSFQAFFKPLSPKMAVLCPQDGGSLPPRWRYLTPKVAVLYPKGGGSLSQDHGSLTQSNRAVVLKPCEPFPPDGGGFRGHCREEVKAIVPLGQSNRSFRVKQSFL